MENVSPIQNTPSGYACHPSCEEGNFKERESKKNKRKKNFPANQPPIIQTSSGGWALTLAEKKRILLNNIYGVDLDAQAVEVAKLSLSLAVLEGATNEQLEGNLRLFFDRALPNLSSNIKCGNSLISSDFYDDNPLDDFTVDEQLRINAFDWSDPTYGFGDILTAGGFDIVIGNPPYVRQETLDTKFKAYLAKNFETYAGTADLYTYFIEKGINLLNSDGHYSIIVANKWLQANYGKALRQWLLKQGIREIIDFGDLPVFKNATAYPLILTVDKGANTDAFQFVNMDTLDFTSLAEHLEGKRVAVEKEYLDENGWKLAPRETQILLKKLFSTGKTLGEYVNNEVYRGVLTGYNEAFVIDSATRKRLIEEDPRSEEIIKPFLAGREVKRYAPLTVTQYVIGTFPAKHYDINNYPAVKKHLLSFGKARIEQSGKPGARKKTKNQWFETQDTIGYWESFEKPKIIFPDIALRMQATLDLENCYCDTTVFLIPKYDAYLLGILNSKLIRFIYQGISPTIRGGYLRFKRQYVERLPIRTIDFSNSSDVAQHDALAKKVEELISLHAQIRVLPMGREQELLARRASTLDRQIDALVYSLYGLTPEEIALIES